MFAGNYGTLDAPNTEVKIYLDHMENAKGLAITEIC